MVKNEFLLNNSKNIDIWILRKEQNLFRSEFYMCEPSLVKIDWEVPVKNARWPPRNWVFLSFQHHTAVISKASSWSTCFCYFYFILVSDFYSKLSTLVHSVICPTFRVITSLTLCRPILILLTWTLGWPKPVSYQSRLVFNLLYCLIGLGLHWYIVG